MKKDCYYGNREVVSFHCMVVTSLDERPFANASM